MRYVRNGVIILLVAFFLYGTAISNAELGGTCFVVAVIILATGFVLNKLDRIERILKENSNENSQKKE